MNVIPAECEACSNSGNLTRIGGLYLCDTCALLEMDAIKELHSSPKMQQVRISKAESIMNMSRAIDTTIKVREDLFNSNTTSIESLRDAIKTSNPDLPEIEQNYLFAVELQKRIKHFQTTIFELQNQLVDTNTAQRATQTYLNTLANGLRAEHREKLKLADISYVPKSPSPKLSKPKAIKIKVSDDEVRKATAVLQSEFPDKGALEFMVRMVIVSKNVNADEACNMVRRALRENE